MQELFEHSLFHEGFINKTDRIVCAVSGGADSTVMTHLFHRAGLEIVVAHCNFQLRGAESDEDELSVKNFCADLGIPFYVRSFDTEKISTERKVSVQETARELRYQWFNELVSELNYDVVATGHNQTDNLETSIINQIRGTGLFGLSGIPKKRGVIFRPLLSFTSEQIRCFAKVNRISFRNDTSNVSDKYVRNKIRNKILPILKEIQPNIESVFSSNSDKFLEASNVLRFFVDKLSSDQIIEKNDLKFIPFDPIISFPHPHVVLSIILSDYGFTYHQLTDIAASEQTGKFIDGLNHRLTIDRNRWVLSPLTLSGNTEIHITEPGIYEFSSKTIRIVKKNVKSLKLPLPPNICILDSLTLSNGLTARTWRREDRIQPFGMKGTKLVSDVFTDNKVPNPIKSSIPIFTNGVDIICVGGLCFSEKFRTKLDDPRNQTYIFQLTIED